jgi:HAD superfamily hydrolase (TIGR01509 family)
MVAAVIFDMDGVIVDSNPIHGAVWLEYLAQHGLPQDGIETWMAGKRNDQIMRRLLGPGASDEDIHRHGAAKEALYRERIDPVLEDRLMPGLRALLDTLAPLPLGLGSNAEPANVDFVLDRAGLRERFQAVVNGHEVEHPKPAPDLYLRVMSLLGVEPEECVIFEDSPSGIQAANAAGARVIGVSVTGRALSGVEFTIRDFQDPALRPWLAALQPSLTAERR